MSNWSYSEVSADRAWLALMADVMRFGVRRPDRTGLGTTALFGTQMRLRAGSLGMFPAVTVKQLYTRPVWGELAAFLEGAHRLEDFHKFGCHIWDANQGASYWQPREGFGDDDLGRIYGVQWREWRVAKIAPSGRVHLTWRDQLDDLVAGLLKDPFGRRHLVTAFNPGELEDMCLPPCHVMFQCFVEPTASVYEGRAAARDSLALHMRVDMRSVDLFLGLPFDIASYATLQAILAKQCGFGVGDLLFQMGDSHIYSNAYDAVAEVFQRIPYEPPVLVLADGVTIDNFRPEHAMLAGYEHHPAVKVEMAV